MAEYFPEDNLKAKLVRNGHWVYDNSFPKTVRISELNFDHYFQLDQDHNW